MNKTFMMTMLVLVPACLIAFKKTGTLDLNMNMIGNFNLINVEITK